MNEIKSLYKNNNLIAILAITLLVIFACISNNSCLAYAQDTTIVETIGENSEETKSEYSDDNIGRDEEYIPSVSLEEITEKISGKLYEVISATQKISIPLCVIFFILAAISAITGIGNKNGFIGGLIGMGLSAFALVCIINAKEIVNFITTWASS